MRQINLGDGTASICTGYLTDDKSKTTDRLLIEPGMGSGVVGGPTNRELNVEFEPNDDSVVFVFSNQASVRAMIGQLENIEKALST